MKALKIGIATEFYYPLLGGITENVHNTRIRLEAMGHDVRILTARCSSDGAAEPEDPRVLRVGRSVTIYSNSSFTRITVGPRLSHDVRRILEREKFDILHIHSPLAPVLPWVALQQARCPTIGTHHTYFQRSLGYSVFRKEFQSRGLDKLDGQIAVSQSCIDALAHYFKIESRIIPNGVDTRIFSPDSAPIEEFRDGKKNLLFIGRFDPRNGLGLMLRAFSIIRAEYGNVRLIVAGRGPLSPYYKLLVPKELRRDVTFVGAVLESRPAYYASCDVFCSPVHRASFGVSLLEAMASGKPIVATENVGYKEIMGPCEGRYAPPKDPAGFARTVLELLDDEPARESMGRNGRTRAMNYSWDRIVPEIVSYYREVLNGR